NNRPAGFFGRFNDRLPVERYCRSNVDNLSADAIRLQSIRRRKRHMNHAARGHESNVAANALHVSHAERNDVFLRWYRPFTWYIILSSKKITGLSSRMALLSSPLASCGVEATATFSPGVWLSQACRL